MSTEKNTPVESLEVWLTGKPYWEQYVWKINLEQVSLSAEDIERSYQYLLEHLGLISSPPETKPPISFKNGVVSIQETAISSSKIRIAEVKSFVDVNALSESCSVKFGPNLTLIYGGTGSGKSGVGRLLCNACFSRGEREILPNVRSASSSAPQAKATFVMVDSSGAPTEVEYLLGDNIDDLKRFSVFDSESVLIHLDQPNHVNFTPAQIKIFDKVADTISKLEIKLINEKNARKKANPFQSMFLDDSTSETAIFCKGITSDTKEDDLLEHANFDPKTNDAVMADLQKQIDGKRKLDIPKKKSQLTTERQNLAALKSTLQGVISRFTGVKMYEINQLVKDILEKKKIVEGLSIKSFDDGVLNTIGSPEWKSLISAAKALDKSEKEMNEGKEAAHCMLCHQKLTKEAKVLFQKYWQLLESKAESELSQLTLRQTAIIQDMAVVKTIFPKFLSTDAGVKELNNDDPKYLTELKIKFESLENVLDDWSSKIKTLQEVTQDNIPTVDIAKIETIIASKTTEESKLFDPTGDITKLTAQLNSLKHKKEATKVKDAALEYLAFLKWLFKANSVNFSSIKMAVTKKRTEAFLVGVAQNYKGVFNQELTNLDCDFNLVMITSGDQGNTVKEYRLDYAEEYNPSQILSEGEQNACSLADFLTEAQLDNNNCGIIFDDPVTSLDHQRKDKIAERFVKEANKRQVVILTHDIVFMSKLAKHADRNSVPIIAHWMKKIDGIPGCVEDNTSPKLTSLASLKNDSLEAVRNIENLNAKEQKNALGIAFDYLRSACEALIEEVMFAKTIERWNDKINVQNLGEVIYDEILALKIVDLHGRLSENILAHNRSGQMSENPPELNDLNAFRKEFDELEASLKKSRKIMIKLRETRKGEKATARAGW